jgi:hypothetical protein
MQTERVTLDARTCRLLLLKARAANFPALFIDMIQPTLRMTHGKTPFQDNMNNLHTIEQ